jgi:iron complex outermembrane receptor protein
MPFFESVPAPAHLVIPTYFSNTMRGGTYGAEISSNWNVTSRWRLIPSYSLLEFNLELEPGSHDTTSLAASGQSPRHQVQIRSNLDISKRLQFDSSIYVVSALPALAVNAYARVDARLGYRPRRDFEISLAGQNLQGGKHVEFVSVEGPYTRAAISRSVFVKLTWESGAR